ncbi:sensor histidine kinase [Gloeothece verrucosa]|uniref:histidine kinase n=1 Tax=Gloeothece verrucosa (strain PCC 7822) TaxID=497965 RepID=E0U784_GLOV7|nr:HAMP domain-containing sensor histidine kinase [Gloeothece verrucosa]ADN12471.1 integral membrane sensor signal transduction histidine kinase [Gloeothece verrucosa PCC 7822]
MAKTNELLGSLYIETLIVGILVVVQQSWLIFLELFSRRASFQHINNCLFFVNLFSSVAILVAVSWLIWLLHKRLKLPLCQIIKISQIWGKGEIKARINYSSSDEIGYLVEVLNRMAAEIELNQQKILLRNQQLENLMATLSHDMRTPLLAARNALRALLQGAYGPVNETWKEIFQEFYQDNQNILQLVETLLDISRYEANGQKNFSYEPLNWKNIFEQATVRIQSITEYNGEIKYHIAPSLPMVYGEELGIQRVIQNLLDNAVRVSKPHQPIKLMVVSSGVEQIQVSIEDSGPGISPLEKERIFYRFIQGQSRQGRCGLGLYLCRQIIEAHGGKINVDTNLGHGSKFWFTLPIGSHELMLK